MTDDESDGMDQFKETVNGFPSYMTVVKENGQVTSIQKLNNNGRSKDEILSAAESLTV